MAVTLLLALLIGVVTGLRSVTGIAVVAGGGLLGWLHFAGTWLSWLDHPVTVAMLVLLAVGELIMDALPRTPSRTGAPGLGSRIVLGGFCGAALATASAAGPGGIVVAVLVAVIGAALGTFGGYRGRTWCSQRSPAGDLPVAIGEDTLAVIAGVLIVYATSLI